MRKLYVLSIVLACAYLCPLFISAQDTCTAVFTYNGAGNTVNFFSNPHLPSTTMHNWIFGDGSAGNAAANPVHTYPSPGTYFVKHYILNQAINCKDSIITEIHVPQIECAITPAFSFSKDSQDCRKIHFVNQSSSSSVAHFVWKFGDGTTSTDVSPTHVYPVDSNYNVCLHMETANNCSKEICKVVEVRCAPPSCDVHAKFEVKRDSLQWNKIWFNNISQPVPNIWRTSWTYGDGSSSQDFNTYHIYQEAGKYFVCLKVQSLRGCVNSYCDSIVVRRVDSCENHSDFRYEASLNNLLEIRFKPTQVNLTWKYYWDFGDGKSSTAVTPIHKYDHAGAYRVCLSVVTVNHCRTQTCKEVRIMPAITINCDTVKLKFIYTRTTQHPNQLSFHAVSNVPVLSQKWVILKLGGQIIPPPSPVVIDSNNPTYTFRDTGWYMVCLYGRTLGDCNKVFCDKVHIERLGNSAEVPGSPVAVIPNPATNSARIVFEMEQAGPVSIKILDALGAAQSTLSAEGQAGNNRISIPVNKLSNGFYMVEIRYGNRLKLAKFQKS